MKKYGGSDWLLQYESFILMIIKDFPYRLEKEFDKEFKDIFHKVYMDIIKQHSKIKDLYFSDNGIGFINFSFLDHYLIICHRVANALYLSGVKNDICDAIYYSCRLRTSTDVYYRAEIGDYFLPCHPLGTVIDSKSKYGIGFQLYSGVNIGPYGIADKSASEWIHPVIGNGVIVYAKSSIYGATTIGDNVVVTPGTIIINEKIPDNCIVFGASPDLKSMPNKSDNLRFFDI